MDGSNREIIEYDLLIKNGQIIDGTGKPSFLSDIGIKDGIIKKIGKSGKAEIPFYTTWIKKDGTLVNSSVNFEIDISTMVTTINAHFED